MSIKGSTQVLAQCVTFPSGGDADWVESMEQSMPPIEHNSTTIADVAVRYEQELSMVPTAADRGRI